VDKRATAGVTLYNTDRLPPGKGLLKTLQHVLLYVRKKYVGSITHAVQVIKVIA